MEQYRQYLLKYVIVDVDDEIVDDIDQKIGIFGCTLRDLLSEATLQLGPDGYVEWGPQSETEAFFTVQRDENGQFPDFINEMREKMREYYLHTYRVRFTSVDEVPFDEFIFNDEIKDPGYE